MKKLFVSIILLFVFAISNAEPYRYEMVREPCNRVENASFYVCRSTTLYVACSVSAQTLCPGYGEPTISG